MQKDIQFDINNRLYTASYLVYVWFLNEGSGNTAAEYINGISNLVSNTQSFNWSQPAIPPPLCAYNCFHDGIKCKCTIYLNNYVGDIRYVRIGTNAIITDTFNCTAPITFEFFVYLISSRNGQPYFRLINSTSIAQIELNWANSLFHIIYGTCDKTGNALPVISGNYLPVGIWYHFALAWTGTNVSLYHDAVLQNPGFNPSPCTLTSTSFFGKVTIFSNVNDAIFRELRAVSYIKSPEEILRYRRKNHFYSSGYDNSPLFLFYYPLDDITSSFCFQNIVTKQYNCQNPALLGNTIIIWKNVIITPLFVCPDSLVYNTVTNKCEYGQAYPGYNLTFLLNGSNINPAKQVLTFWCYVNITPSTSITIASYQYNSNKYTYLFF